MRKKLLLMFVVAAMFAVSAIGQNLVPNGNMDTWSNETGVPDGYVRSGTSAVQMTRVEGRGGSGYATRFQTSSYTGNGSNRLWSPEFPFIQQGTYKISFWVKGDGRMSTVRVVASNTSANGGTGEIAANVVISAADWTLMEYNFSSFASPVAYVCFVFDKVSGGSDTDVLLDDISVEFISSKITNGDMSAWTNASGLADGYVRTGTNDLTGVLMSQAEGRGGAGDYATRFQTSSFTANNTNRFWSPGFSITKMGAYKISFWVKGTGNLSILRMTSSASSVDGTIIVGGTAGTNGKYPTQEFNYADWTQVTYTFTSFFQPKTSANYGQLYAKYYACFVFNKATAGSSDADILLDDISLEYVSDNLMQNGDMEMWSDGNSPAIPNNYVIGSQNDVANSFFKAVGRGGSGNAMHIQSIYTSANSANRIFCPYTVVNSGSIYCLDTTKTYRLSFWLKGEGRLQYLYVQNSMNSLTGAQQIVNSSSGINFNYADWTQVYFDFVPTNPLFRNIAMIICGQTSGTKSDAYLDDISIKEYISDDATLKNIIIPDPANSSTNYDYSLPGFVSGTTNYTVPLWFGADTVPDMKIETNNPLATYVVDNGGSNSFVSGAKTKNVTIKVTAENGTKQDYTVTFDRTNYVVGFFRVESVINTANSTTLAQFSDIKGLFGPSNNPPQSHGDYWGCNAIRPYGTGSSVGQAYLVTKPLVNGAGTVSFWTGNRSAAYSTSAPASGPNDEMLIKVSYTIDGGTSWTNVDSIQVDTTALHGKWTKVSYDIKKTDPNTQVKLEYLKVGAAPKFLPIDIDDICITPWLGTDIPEIKIKPFVALNIYPQGQAIVVAEEGRYMIYTVSGQLIASGNNRGQVITIPVKSGLYIAKSGNQAKKLVVK